jgi:3-oxoacyl-[acyl-carrier protein] reductase
MDYRIKDKLFVVSGASSGFGKAITEALLCEGAKVIVNARGEEGLQNIAQQHPSQVEVLVGDITTDAVIANLFRLIGNRFLDGMVINAGGPPSKSFVETELTDWDQAYQNILRWKVKMTQELLDKFRQQQYGRILYIESATVKQPLENLVLSNSMRLAVVGMVKTLSQEVASDGITANIIAPGYHFTPAMERLFNKKSILLGISLEEAKALYASETITGKLGDPADMTPLALWLLSPSSSFVSGQTISVDGGLIKGTMG